MNKRTYELTYENFFKNFANKTRFQIINTLAQGPKSVTQIAKETEKEQSRISHHLREMRNCNIIKAEKKGKKRIYSVDKETVLPMLKIAKEHVERHCGSNCTKLKERIKKYIKKEGEK